MTFTLATEEDALAPALQIRALAKSFPGQRALAGIDLTIAPGEVHALLGENGSGKSTLIKILSGFHKPDAGGEVLIGGTPLSFGNPVSSHQLGARFVHQDLGLVGTSSVADNVCLGGGFPTRWGAIGTRRHHALTRELLDRAGLDLDPGVLVNSLLPAQKTGIAIARALRPDPAAPAHLIVLDEPTATLPDSDVDHLLQIVERVAARGVAVVYVTHRIDEVFKIADRVTVLREGSKVASRPVDGLTRPDLVSLLVGEDFPDYSHGPQTEATASGRTVLSVQGLTSDRINGISFETKAHSVTGLAGITGSGRETTLGLVFGAAPRTSGSVMLDGVKVRPFEPSRSIEAGMGYMPPDRKTAGGVLSASARENVSLTRLRPFVRLGAIRRKSEKAETAEWFQALSIRPSDGADLPLAVFSGGNQQKVLLAKWLRCEPKLLLLDEPTQGVDLGAKAQIHQRLRQAADEGASVVVSCSDPDELASLCDRVLVLRGGLIVSDLSGSAVTAERISRLTHDGEG